MTQIETDEHFGLNPMPGLLNTRQEWLEQPCLTLFGIYLRNLRHEMKLSQVEFAFRASIGHPNIYQWERGKRHPGLDSIKRLANFVGVTELDMRREVQKSLDFAKKHGEEGIAELVARQPRAQRPRGAVESFIAGTNPQHKPYNNLRADGGPTVWVKFTLPVEYEEYIRDLAPVRDQTVSTIIGEAIMGLIDSGHWESKTVELEDDEELEE